MTAGVLERPLYERPQLDRGRTLEDLLDATLREALTDGSTACPVCHAGHALTRAGAREAECRRCGSRLS